MLIVSDQFSYTSEQQLAVFRAYRRALRNQLGLVSRSALPAEALAFAPARLAEFDLIGIKIGFRTSASEVLRTVQTLRDSAPRAKLVYFDGDDDLCIQWPELLPLVDLYVKKHAFRDRSKYLQGYVGKSNLTDYVARTFGTSFETDIITHSRPVPEAELGKIVVGWNIGLDDKIRLLAKQTGQAAFGPKTYDVVCRATVSDKSWMYPLRAPITPTVRRLEGEHRVLTPEHRVPPETYLREMLSAKICVSPFGFGEICWRDFEAILCGCVVVKPDMAHVETTPDVFVPGETYVPVRWDYADLEATLREMLANPERCEVLKSNARAKLLAHYEDARVVELVRGVLGRVGFA